MKDPELNNKVSQKMEELDRLGNISPSAQWQDSLLDKLSDINQDAKQPIFKSNIIVIIILCIVINASFIINLAFRHHEDESARADHLPLISKEFFINPISLKN